MRFLIDECAGPALARWLRDAGHDVVSVFETERGASDARVLALAVREKRILVTADKDFGDRVYRAGERHRGVVLLRLADERAANKIAAVARLLAQHGARISGRFVVVTEATTRLSSGEPMG
jgi:predicted nuclease of predicted toxin-antitoxin system